MRCVWKRCIFAAIIPQSVTKKQAPSVSVCLSVCEMAGTSVAHSTTPSLMDASALRADADAIDALEATLVKKVQFYLATFVFANACFLAERLVAHVRMHMHCAAGCRDCVCVCAHTDIPLNASLRDIRTERKTMSTCWRHATTTPVT